MKATFAALAVCCLLLASGCRGLSGADALPALPAGAAVLHSDLVVSTEPAIESTDCQSCLTDSDLLAPVVDGSYDDELTTDHSDSGPVEMSEIVDCGSVARDNGAACTSTSYASPACASTSCKSAGCGCRDCGQRNTVEVINSRLRSYQGSSRDGVSSCNRGVSRGGFAHGGGVGATHCPRCGGRLGTLGCGDCGLGFSGGKLGARLGTGLMGCAGGGRCNGRCGSPGACGGRWKQAVKHMPVGQFKSFTAEGCANGLCGLPPGPQTGAVQYPYYTIRGPRDFLLANPPSIGP